MGGVGVGADGRTREVSGVEGRTREARGGTVVVINAQRVESAGGRRIRRSFLSSAAAS